MLVYILKSSACLGIFFLFYKLFLEKESKHLFKRFYLLIALAAAFLIPLITFTNYEFITPIQEFELLDFHNSEDLIQNNIQTIAPIVQINNISIVLWSIYSLGVLFFLIRFILNLSKIIAKIRKNPHIKNNSFVHVLLKDLAIPHTFFKYIFLNKYKFDAKQIPKEVIIHEQAHARQKHSFDILFIELVQIACWFNPLIYFVKHAMNLNHEFLADKAVLSKGIETASYQKTLLNYTSKNRQVSLANAINYSFIKKRFTIMKKNTSKRAIWMRSFLLLPLSTILIYGFSEKVVVEKLTPQIQEKQQIEVQQELEDINKLKLNYTTKATPEQLMEYNKLTKYYKSIPKGTLIVKVDDVERLKHLFNMLSPIQKQQAESFPDFSILASPPPKMDTIYTYDRMANHVKYVSKNRSANIIYLKNIYREMTAAQKQQVTSPDELKKIFYFQDKATPEQLAEYNRLAKYYNAMSKNDIKVKLKDSRRLEYIYSLMSITQKKKAETFPNFPPPPLPTTGKVSKVQKSNIPPPLQKNKWIVGVGTNNNVNTDQNKQESIKKSSWKVVARTNTSNNITTSGERNKIDSLDIDEIIKNRPSLLKKNATNDEVKKYNDDIISFKLKLKKHGIAVGYSMDNPPPSPLSKNPSPQQISIFKDKVTEYQRKDSIFMSRSKITQQSLTPPNPLDHIISLAKKGAMFYYENQKISSDKAIELVKKKASIHIQVNKHDSSNPVVKLSNKNK